MSTDESGREAAAPFGVRPLWVGSVVVVLVIALFIAVPGGRKLIGSFVRSLRQSSVQTVNVNLSSFVGPDANQTVQQMISQMVSANVTTLVSEKRQDAQTPGQASQLAGFPVQLLAARYDAPQLSVSGRRELRILVDRARLQAILQEAGRRDLLVPTAIDGAAVTLQIPRMVRARYGSCPRPASAAANVATPPPTSTQYTDCLVLIEGPRPQMSVPAGFDFAPLAQIGLEAAGMTASQAREFLQRVHWQSLLGVTIPRSLRSYSTVEVDGVQGTLFNMAARRGPSYTLIWSKGNLVYSLVGYGDSVQAVTLANSLS
jgi:hypothetical protein